MGLLLTLSEARGYVARLRKVLRSSCFFFFLVGVAGLLGRCLTHLLCAFVA